MSLDIAPHLRCEKNLISGAFSVSYSNGILKSTPDTYISYSTNTWLIDLGSQTIAKPFQSNPIQGDFETKFSF